MDVLLRQHVAGQHAVDRPRPQPRLRMLRVFAELSVHAGEIQVALVGRVGIDDPADLAGVDAFHDLLVGRMGPGLEIREERQLLRGRLLAAVGDRLAAGNVHGDRFGEIDMLAGGDRGGGLLGMEVGRALDHHGVQLLVDQLLVAGESGKPLVRRHAELVAGIVRLVLEVIEHRDHVVAAVFLEQVGNPRAASAATDQADVDPRVGVGAAHELGREDGE